MPEGSLTAKKSLGQHFLRHSAHARDIALAANVRQCHVVEVGAGAGLLTHALLEGGAHHVTAVEKDRRFIPSLHAMAKKFAPRLTVVEKDALTQDLRGLAHHKVPHKLVGNLPYNIATALFSQWLDYDPWPPPFESYTLMFQKEVAARLTAIPQTKAYGRLSLLTNWRGHAHTIAHLKPEDFIPAPKVHSTVITFTPEKKQGLGQDTSTYQDVKNLSALLFATRRKMLRSSLQQALTFVPKTTRADLAHSILRKAGIDPRWRPESLDPPTFQRLLSTVNTARQSP